MEELNKEYEQLCIKLLKSFAAGTIDGIINDFTAIVKDNTINDMTAGSIFGFLLLWWTEDYKYPGDDKSQIIIKQSLLAIQEYRPVVYPQMWRHLQTTHLALVRKLFPERF